MALFTDKGVNRAR